MGMTDAAVIGSGPTAFAAVAALRSKGLTVLVLDIGERLDPDRMAVVAEAGSMPPIRWTPDLRRRLDGGTPRLARIAQKLYFGSDVPYRLTDGVVSPTISGSSTLPMSMASGGFSNVWGAGTLTPSPADLGEWPIDPEDLRRSYRTLADLIPITGRHDALDDRYPFTGEFAGEPNVSSRFRTALGQAAPHDAGKSHVLIGAARLAVKPFGHGCERCGRCLSGCPYGAIFNSGPAIDDLASDPGVILRSGAAVMRLSETDAATTIEFVDTSTNVLHRAMAKHTFVAAGPVGSVSLLQRSGLCPGTVEIRDSQVFYVPIVHRHRWSADAAQFTLGQLFAVSSEAGAPDRDFQLTAYDTSDDLAGRVALAVPAPLKRIADRVAPLLTRRLTGGIGFLHSDVSGTLRITTTSQGTAVTAVASPATRPVLRDVLRRAAAALRPLGLYTVPPAAQVPAPGTGFHIGAALPMSHEPQAMSSDSLGRPFGSKRIHVVDATVLPFLLPGPTTFTAMANAHRIASFVGASG